ncbi:hypothetical protein KY285_023974 [Solanum tuberosum]|nr:hypothetical protein KY289_024321 [Solanum tuberosum]KAH0676173.1 hypothetical protein KY285_023974 [Solanum tuberosum]
MNIGLQNKNKIKYNIEVMYGTGHKENGKRDTLTMAAATGGNEAHLHLLAKASRWKSYRGSG